MHFGYGKKASKKTGILLKDLKRMKKHKKRGNLSRIQLREDYAQGESE